MSAHRHPPAGRFNAGQKMIYWIVVLGGGAVAASGYLLMFPFYGTNIADMQLAQVVHGVVAVLFVAAMLGHIYIGTIGMEGAFEGMWDGTVDVNWAKEHHSLWAQEEIAKGHVSAPPPKDGCKRRSSRRPALSNAPGGYRRARLCGRRRAPGGAPHAATSARTRRGLL